MKAKAKKIDNGELIEGYYKTWKHFNGVKNIAIHTIDNTEYNQLSRGEFEIDPSTLVFPEMEELKKQNDELLKRLRQFRARIYQQSFSNMQLREMADGLISIQKAEGSEK